MRWSDWYTDTADVYRVTSSTTNNLTTNSREKVLSAVPCRIYQSDSKAPTMSQTAASISEESRLACDNSVDIRAGDMLIIYRGGGLSQTSETFRAFAGEPNHYYEPVGAVSLGLAHQQIRLLNQERINNEGDPT